VTGTLVGVRLQDDELKAIDKWARKQEPPITRPYAIRRLVELGLTVKAKGRPKSQDTKRRANELADCARVSRETFARVWQMPCQADS